MYDSEIDQKQQEVSLSVDLIMAFDVIRHDILFTKLENAGIRGFILVVRFISFKRHHKAVVNIKEFILIFKEIYSILSNSIKNNNLILD